MDPVEKEERAKLSFWEEFLGVPFDSETFELMIESAVIARRIDDMMKLIIPELPDPPYPQYWIIATDNTNSNMDS